MITNNPFIICPKEVIGKILSYLPLTRNTLESRTTSNAFKQIFDNKEYVPDVCDLLDKVKVLKETKTTLKEFITIKKTCLS